MHVLTLLSPCCFTVKADKVPFQWAQPGHSVSYAFGMQDMTFRTGSSGQDVNKGAPQLKSCRAATQTRRFGEEHMGHTEILVSPSTLTGELVAGDRLGYTDCDGDGTEFAPIGKISDSLWWTPDFHELTSLRAYGSDSSRSQ